MSKNESCWSTQTNPKHLIWRRFSHQFLLCQRSVSVICAMAASVCAHIIYNPWSCDVIQFTSKASSDTKLVLGPWRRQNVTASTSVTKNGESVQSRQFDNYTCTTLPADMSMDLYMKIVHALGLAVFWLGSSRYYFS
jgi:hypothetical protein